MRVLFALVTAAILYLSLFPGRFDWSRPLNWFPHFHPIVHNSDVIDVIVNVPFYMPLGFTLVAGWMRKPGWRAVAVATLAGTLLSYGVELTQQFILPRRFSNSRDILFNAIGAALGGWMATRTRWRKVRLSAFGQSAVGWWLVALWWTWLVFPFYPNIRLVQLRRMVEHSQEELAGAGFSLVVIGAHLVGGAVLASLSAKRRWVMPLAGTVALFLMVFIYGLRFSPWRLAATLAGFALARFVRRPVWLFALVAAWSALYLFYFGMPGLAPYDTTWEVAPAVARESWRTPVRDGAGKLFLASALMWSAWRLRR